MSPVSDDSPVVSIVLPTFREAESLPLIVPEIAAVIEDDDRSYEIVVVDDASPDGTAEVARELGERFPVRVIERRERGLATAVVRGFREARGRLLVVMDADGSHPVNTLPALLKAIDGPGDPSGATVALAVGSRHAPGGGFRHSSARNRLVSRFAALFARPLTTLSDPTSGFMAVRQELFEGLELDPIGWKIVLEVVVKAQPCPFIEIPILFDDRRAGQSKQSLWAFLQYLQHCRRLWLHQRSRRH